jgi:hypothetical protein
MVAQAASLTVAAGDMRWSRAPVMPLHGAASALRHFAGITIEQVDWLYDRATSVGDRGITKVPIRLSVSPPTPM